MAKGIDVAITAGGGGTPVTYSLERQINSGGYSVIDASITYTGSPQTYSDTGVGGLGFSDSDVVDYRATATNVDGTSSASSVAQITISVTAETWLPGVFTLNNYTKDGLNYVCDVAGATTNAGHSTTAVLVGDFDVRAELITSGSNPQGYNTSKTVIAARTDAGFSLISNTFSMYDNVASVDIRVLGPDTTPDNPQAGTAAKDGLYFVVRRRGSTFTYVIDDNGSETLVHTATGQSTADMYIFLQNGTAGNSVYNPEYKLIT